MQIVKLMMVITIPASQRRELVLILGGGGGNEGGEGDHLTPRWRHAAEINPGQNS